MPPIPGDIVACINKVVARPQSLTSKRAVARAIARLKRSEARKTRCGRRLIRLYNKYRNML